MAPSKHLLLLALFAALSVPTIANSQSPAPPYLYVWSGTRRHDAARGVPGGVRPAAGHRHDGEDREGGVRRRRASARITRSTSWSRTGCCSPTTSAAGRRTGSTCRRRATRSCWVRSRPQGRTRTRTASCGWPTATGSRPTRRRSTAASRVGWWSCKPDGTALRWASAAPADGDSTQLVPYSLDVLAPMDRVVSTSTSMTDLIGVNVQVWRLSDLKLLQTMAVPIAHGARRRTMEHDRGTSHAAG